MKDLILGLGILLSTASNSPPPLSTEPNQQQFQTIPTLPDINNMKISVIQKPQHKTLSIQEKTMIYQYGKTAVLDECLAQKTLYWCNDQKIKTKVMKSSELVIESLKVREKFVYKDEIIDRWRSHTGDILLDSYWFGDCDDLVSTTMDMISRRGQPLTKMWMVLVSVKTTDMMDHVVGVVQDNNGDYWVVGDTDSKSAYPLEMLTYRVVAVSRMDKVMEWKDPHSFGFFEEATMQVLIKEPATQTIKALFPPK